MLSIGFFAMFTSLHEQDLHLNFIGSPDESFAPLSYSAGDTSES